MKFFSLLTLALCVALADPFAPAYAPGPISSGLNLSHPPKRIHIYHEPRSGGVTSGAGHMIHSVINITKPMKYGDSIWNEPASSSGVVWIRVDLKRQILSVFRGGDEIGSTVVLYGADRKPTPRGDFHILAMLKDHRSDLYDAPMPYTLRITGDGVAIHGSRVRMNAATHGCIGVPTDFAAHLFSIIHVGDSVEIH